MGDLEIAYEAFRMEARYAGLLRGAAQALVEDLATQDLVLAYLRQHQNWAWFLREFVRTANLGDYAGDVRNGVHV